LHSLIAYVCVCGVCTAWSRWLVYAELVLPHHVTDIVDFFNGFVSSSNKSSCLLLVSGTVCLNTSPPDLPWLVPSENSSVLVFRPFCDYTVTLALLWALAVSVTYLLAYFCLPLCLCLRLSVFPSFYDALSVCPPTYTRIICTDFQRALGN